jgi:alanine racemase
MHDTSQLHVDLTAIDHNMQVIRRVVGRDCAICPIVKADAYGLGAVRIARQLVESGADMLAVYTPEQAGELARAGISGVPTLILMPVRDITRVDELYRWLVCGRLHLTVHDLDHLHDLRALAERFGAKIPVHLEVDTGMCRGGCSLDDVGPILSEIASTRWLHLAGVFTHFAAADNDVGHTDRQLAKFHSVIDENAAAIPADCLLHVASTYAMLRHPRFHKSMVRVGLAWAGYGLESMQGGEIIVAGEDLWPSLTWSSRVVQVRMIDKGTSIGYGGKWTATRRSMIGLVPVGYADGYPIHSGATDARPRGAQVGVVAEGGGAVSHGFVPVVGAINMDQIAIDLTDVAFVPGSPGAGIGVGSTVELISPHASAPNHLPKLAAMAGTIPHELICRINPRIRRTFHVTRVPVTVPSSAAVVVG